MPRGSHAEALFPGPLSLGEAGLVEGMWPSWDDRPIPRTQPGPGLGYLSQAAGPQPDALMVRTPGS